MIKPPPETLKPTEPKNNNSENIESADSNSGKTGGLPLSVLWIIVACFICVGCYFLYAAIKHDPQKELVPEISQLRSRINESVEALSAQTGTVYTIDEKYYNEEVAQAFVDTVAIVSNSEPSAVPMNQYLSKLFNVAVDANGEHFLVQKDSMTLVGECDNAIFMNILDYKLLGTENDELTALSKGVYISQNSPDFETIAYGTSNLRYSGCGPVSLAMAINYVAGEQVVSVENVVEWANENNMYEEGYGTRWALFRNYPPVVSLKSEELVISSGAEALEAALLPGQVMICSMSKGHFTDNGHIILITEISDGKATVLDPASIWRSLQKWDVSLLYEESNKHFWRISSTLNTQH